MAGDIEGKKSKLVRYFSKTISGFFIGVGFSIAIIVVFATVEYTGQETWERIHIQVELFDSNKAFVDQCSGLIWDTINADQIRIFKVTCGECNNVPLAKFSSYEIKILDAS